MLEEVQTKIVGLLRSWLSKTQVRGEAAFVGDDFALVCYLSLIIVK